jgi:hypothetical protein
MKISLGLQLDPDFRAQLEGLHLLVRDAYDRGAISWARRGELIEALSEGGTGLFDVRLYQRAQTEAETVLYGAFLEPSPALLAEIDMPEWKP